MSNASGYQQLTVFGSTIIASGQTTSAVYDNFGGTPTALYFPSNFVGSSITFSVSDDNVTYYDLFDGSLADTNKLTVSGLTASSCYPLNVGFSCGFRYLKIIAGSSQSSGAVTIKIATAPIFPLISAA